MPKAKVTLSLPEELARYLRSTPNASSTVAEAVTEYRARRLERELAEAYREDAKESEDLNREWEGADAALSE